ncbi:serine hydrolase [Lapidilactobacillus bayanensis]|uniref:serine hydrolase n=1 Tax=Lapidilactobacillus bayanensis TaxID=2485998 RepID=UPI0013DE3296|nr:serine hydrolase [Lapidilactobacillus bayanensis]
MKAKLQHLFLCLVLALGFASLSGAFITQQQVSAATSIAVPDTTINATAGIAVDADTGQILAEKDSQKVLPIASMSKLLSIYLVLKAVKEGKISWSKRVTPSTLTYSLSQNMELSNIPFESGTAYTVKELYDASLIYSANSAIMVLADAISGSQDKFVDAMKAQLKEWGITNEKIVNVSGLPNSYLGTNRYPGSSSTDENELSARDVAIIAKHVLDEFPEILKTASQTSLPFHGTTYSNWNLMLKGQTAAESDLPVDGLKTGTGDAAGDCFVGTVKKNGFRIITVVLHANGSDTDTAKRFTATAALMHSIYQNWEIKTVLKKNGSSAVLTPVKVTNSKQTTVKVVAGETVKMLLPKSTKSAQLNFVVSNSDVSRTAPIKKGAQLGKVQLPAIGSGYLTGTSARAVSVLAKQSVTALTWWQKAWHNMTGLFN